MLLCSLSRTRPAPGSFIRTLSTAPPTAEAYLTRQGAISFLTLNRPAARNALSMRMLDEVRRAVEEVRFDGYVCLALFPH